MGNQWGAGRSGKGFGGNGRGRSNNRGRVGHGGRTDGVRSEEGHGYEAHPQRWERTERGRDFSKTSRRDNRASRDEEGLEWEKWSRAKKASGSRVGASARQRNLPGFEEKPAKFGQSEMFQLAKQFELEYESERKGRGDGKAAPKKPAISKKAAQDDGLQRLHKVLANAGVASRRECEKLIISGRVKVNGKVVRELGTRVDPTQIGLHVDGKPVLLDDRQIVVILNKPEGVESTMSDGANTLAPLIEKYGQRLYHVGRLDRDTTGLLLLTNNGELAHRLTHPRYEIQKTYLASVEGSFKGGLAKKLLDGVELEDGLAICDKVSIRGEHDGRTLVQVTLHNGKNRIVRRMFEALGHPVLELSRLSMGPVKLGSLKLGASRRMSKGETEILLQSVGL